MSYLGISETNIRHLLAVMGLSSEEIDTISTEILNTYAYPSYDTVLLYGIKNLNQKMKSLEEQLACIKTEKTS